jgi:sugar/nucleoside kinase (ribokinase family)
VAHNEPAGLDVVGIGNAIVDVIARADDRFIAEQGMVKGSMALIDETRAAELYAAMGATITASGGSTANTVAGIASFGGRTGFIGKVRDDVLGAAFRNDITAVGAAFPTLPTTDGPATAVCLILVTPDAQRTMNTYLGACVELTPDDVDDALIRSAGITHLEGYLYDPPLAQEAFHKAAAIAHAAGRKVSLSLSDTFCVQRHRAEFLSLVDHHVDVLFANEHEVAELFQTGDVATIVARLRQMTGLAAVTRGPGGSLVVTPETVIEVAAAPAQAIVDTTGAGDLYAAGFLFGLTSGRPLAECGRIGSIAAAEVIGHVGARPQVELAGLIASS